MRPEIDDAIRSLVSGSGVAWSLSDGAIKNWDINNEGIPRPTDEEINTELTRLQTDYDAKDYARKRKAEYPSLNDFAEAYTEKEFGGDATKMDAYKIKYEKVRSDNPK